MNKEARRSSPVDCSRYFVLKLANADRNCHAGVINISGGEYMAHKFEIYKDKAGEFRVRFKYNSEVMFSTEGYSTKASAQNAIDSIKKNGPDASVEDNS
ncbi:uncharacterized protein YegP (UPF0339 family) [Rhizobium herbae]|uniref:Uncharacterized protein YegP (UPF0339 family) n=2 Tax=Rhizobium herbae TaxID=508661 RepID=A0ABS4EFP1_9HYPH|nr:uncharacterized protein YegP (UPF0339 family) [Rhizobium herbae]